MSLDIYSPRQGSIGDSKAAPDPDRCAVGVMSNERWSRYSQCSNKAKHDAVISGQQVRVCTIHRPDKVAERRAAAQARYDQETAKWHRLHMRPHDYAKALREIAEGHNDPRARAIEALEKWNDLPTPD